jgi:predicted RNase H-like HicB family nuclease
MSKKDHYVYPAVFEYDKPGVIGVSFPDLPGCISVGENETHAYQMAKEALSLHLYSMEEDGDNIPEPSSPQDILLDQENLVIVMIDVWMEPFRDEMENKAIKKTVTVPRWLNKMAENSGINFSQTLTYALKQRLGVVDHRKKRDGD